MAEGNHMKLKKQVWAVLSIVALLLVIVCGVVGFVVPFFSNQEMFRSGLGSIMSMLQFKGELVGTAMKVMSYVYAGVFYVFCLAFLILLAGTLATKKFVKLIPTIIFMLATAAFAFIGGLTVYYWDNSAADMAKILLLVFSVVLILSAILCVVLYLLYDGEGQIAPVAAEEEDAPVAEEKVEEKPVEAAAPVAEEKKEEKPAEAEAKPESEKEEEAPAEAAEPVEEETPAKSAKQSGKYEVFPEAGFFKYRLKANNGEILLVSNGYKTSDGAKAGIATLKKNLNTAVFRIKVDKNGYAQFLVFTSNESRLLVSGEIYQNEALAKSALESVKKFGKARKIVDLKEIPEVEIREWKIELPPAVPNPNGKFEIYIDENTKKWKGRLLANNGVIIMVTSNYSSKNAVLNAFENIKTKVAGNSLSISRDKMGRYQYRVYADNGSVMVMGETYPSYDSALSSAISVSKFIADAKVIDTTKAA